MPFALATFPLTEITPNFIDPADNGALIANLTPGTFIDISLFLNAYPDQPGRILFTVGTDAATSTAFGPDYISGNDSNDPAIASPTNLPRKASLNQLASALNNELHIIGACNLYAQWLSDATPPTAVDLIALVKTYS